MAKDKKLIEEATRDITELVVIDNEDVTKRKIISFIKTYKLFSMAISRPMVDVVCAFEMKYDLDVSFDKEGKVVITKSKEVK